VRRKYYFDAAPKNKLFKTFENVNNTSVIRQAEDNYFSSFCVSKPFLALSYGRKNVHLHIT
jgi:hypothetical protein